ncbi:MAG: hypothetical protein Q8K93_10710 [Reyranella sp.]|uniref:hypothetical protein n=1 Tax=Reyranella sp. TaxID=1929291 RepID=UPI002730ACCE|nr:hypothetical protein [Reyranella sp.]MDP1962657.1 hypothetical protein [Reyranella sp.]MDP2372531.1 hypothetical protein [Reyranella sp.]
MRPISIALIAISCAALASPTWAQKDKDKDNSPDRGGPKIERGPAPAGGAAAKPGQAVANAPVVISDRDRTAAYTYYRTEYAAGNCPPGLAKKNNGCLPPGQAKKIWVIGQPLPTSVVYYPLPPALVLQLTPPPAGHEYVRVANDILLLSIGTRMVASAVADLARLGNDR